MYIYRLELTSDELNMLFVATVKAREAFIDSERLYTSYTELQKKLTKFMDSFKPMSEDTPVNIDKDKPDLPKCKAISVTNYEHAIISQALFYGQMGVPIQSKLLRKECKTLYDRISQEYYQQ